MRRIYGGIFAVVILAVLAGVSLWRPGRASTGARADGCGDDTVLADSVQREAHARTERQTPPLTIAAQQGRFEEAMRVADLVAQQFDERRRDYTRPYSDEEVHIMTQASYYCDLVVEGPRLGAALYTTRQYSNALDVFTVLFARTSEDVPAVRDSTEFSVAETLYFLGSYDKAENMLTNLMQRTHESTNWYGVYASAARVMAEIRVAQQRYAEAVAWYDEMLRCDLSAASRKVVEGDKRVIMNELLKSDVSKRRKTDVRHP